MHVLGSEWLAEADMLRSIARDALGRVRNVFPPEVGLSRVVIAFSV
jgi:hypothetical protein